MSDITDFGSSTRLEGAATAGAACSSPVLHPAGSDFPKPSKKGFHPYVKVDAATILPNNLKKWGDYANYLQHRILVGRMYWQIKKTGFVSLNRRTLERAIHSSILSPVLNWMIWNKVIERDGSRREWAGFKPARRKDGSDGVSIGYRFCAAYDRLPMQRIACRSVKARNKFLKLQNPPERMANYTKVHKHLRSWLRHVNLDLPTALELVSKANLDPVDAEAVVCLSRYIANGDAVDLTVCDYGRVHTAITRLLAPIRQCLNTKGQPLVELDIANSQPLFLAIYILQTISNKRITSLPDSLHPCHQDVFSEGEGDISSCSRLCKIQFPHPSHPSFFPPLLYVQRKLKKYSVTCSNRNGLRQNCLSSPFLPTDLLIFLQHCMMGSLYEYLMREIAWTGSRRSFKDEFFLMLYGPLTDSPMTQVMQREFPSVMAFMVWHKRRHGFKQLSREMQRAESKLMIEGVCGTLMERNPRIPLLTIHDSIMTTAEFIPVVSKTIRAEFRKLGIWPTVKTKQPTFEDEIRPSLLENIGIFNPWDMAA